MVEKKLEKALNIQNVRNCAFHCASFLFETMQKSNLLSNNKDYYNLKILYGFQFPKSITTEQINIIFCKISKIVLLSIVYISDFLFQQTFFTYINKTYRTTLKSQNSATIKKSEMYMYYEIKRFRKK